jgi:hemerythrin-like domain-containing protein
VGGARRRGRGEGASGSAGVDPFALLERSHQQLEERLSDLQQAAGAIVRERAGADEVALVDAVIAFLERAAARHEQDEEESLFPRLRGVADLTTLLEELASEHLLHRHLILQLRSLRSRWPAAGPDAGDGASLIILANELARAYRVHIAREERELLPVARENLRPDEVDGIRTEMARRRELAQGETGRPRRRYPAGSTGPRIREV